MNKRSLQIGLLIVLLIAGGKWWNPLWRSDLNKAVDPESRSKIVFTIEKGSSAKTIAEALEDSDLIVNQSSFMKDVEALDLSRSLRYGSFVLSPGMTLSEIVSILTTAGTGELALTVPEGWTIEDIDAKLSEMNLIEPGAFTNCTLNCTFEFDFAQNQSSLEGYLFPDTYFIDNQSFKVEILIGQMLQNFERKWTEEMQAQLEKSGHSLDEVLSVASMLEKEVRTQEDLRIVSGIIWKRLKNDWTLGIDATLLYKDEDGVLTGSDLAKDTPYNTRLKKGLPPTPICNPGLATLKAALNPKDSDYWFYLTDSEGAVHYAVTNAEHEENKAKYLK